MINSKWLESLYPLKYESKQISMLVGKGYRNPDSIEVLVLGVGKETQSYIIPKALIKGVAKFIQDNVPIFREVNDNGDFRLCEREIEVIERELDDLIRSKTPRNS